MLSPRGGNPHNLGATGKSGGKFGSRDDFAFAPRSPAHSAGGSSVGWASRGRAGSLMSDEEVPFCSVPGSRTSLAGGTAGGAERSSSAPPQTPNAFAPSLFTAAPALGGGVQAVLPPPAPAVTHADAPLLLKLLRPVASRTSFAYNGGHGAGGGGGHG
eukprot:Rhum_TRINITY_DN14479_c35_g1::Rhum_TRINITY_DN14479_c35_g1_i1::g.92019::m.92019